MSRRARLPGAEELFRRTSAERAPAAHESAEAPSARLQVAEPGPGSDASAGAGKKQPKHDEKVTFYCTREDLMALESVRLKLRADHGVAADRGRIVRAALGYVLEDFEARASDSILLRRLQSRSS